jgi:HlyD family secretion protein
MVYLPEGEVAKVGLQDAAEISIDAFPEKTFRGIVVFISPESEFTPKNIQTKDERTKLVFAVKIEIENEGMKLKAGLPADAKIRIKG